MNTKNISAENLSKIFSFDKKTSLSEAIILSALSINKRNKFLRVKDYRDSAFSILWEKQFHHGANWLAQFRSELNQGDGRLAHRVFEWNGESGIKSSWKFKPLSKLSTADKKTIEKLKKLLKSIEDGTSIPDDDNDEDFQKSVSWMSPKRTKKGKIAKKKKKTKSQTSSFPRDARIAKAALIDANYKCQIESGHKTFINPKTDNNYVEAHHVIPMEYYDQFTNCIDVEANIAALCPNCHREIHFSDIKNKEKLIKKLMTADRKKSLDEKGISITVKKLLSFYK